MGKAARNHGGTGGHGVSPMFGEKPNYNRHVMGDRLLLGLVPTNQRSMLRHQKVSSKLLMTGVAESLPDSCKRLSQEGLQQAPPLRSPSQEDASVDQTVSTVKQHVASVKQHVPSAKQFGASVIHLGATVMPPVASDKQPVALVKKPVAPVKQHVDSVKQPVALVKNPVASVKQHVASVKKPVASVKRNIASVKQPVVSVNQPVVSVKQPLASVDQLVSSFKQPVASVKQPVASVKEQVNPGPDTLLEQQPLISDKPLNTSVQETLIKAQHPTSKIETVNSVKPPVTSVDISQQQQTLGSGQNSMIKAQLPVTKIQHSVTSSFRQDILQEQQTLSLDDSLIYTEQKSVMKAKLPVTTDLNSENSTQYSVTSDNQPTTSVTLSVSSPPGLDTMIEPQTLGSDQTQIKAQFPENLFLPSVTSSQQSVTSVKQPVTSTQKSLTSIAQPVTLTQQSLTSIDQPVTSTQPTLTSVKQPVVSVKLQETSAQILDELKEQQTLTSPQLKIDPGQHFPNAAKMTLGYRANKPHGYHEIPKPMVYWPPFQTIIYQEWVKVSPILISYHCISVPPFQLPSGLVQIPLSPVMFIANNSSQAHQIHQPHRSLNDYMTSMQEQD